MVDTMSRNWWVLLLRGIMAIIFGVLAILFPGEALAALVYIFGVYALIDGAVTLYQALVNPGPNRVWHALEGIVGIVAGIVAFVYTGLTAITLVYLIAIWAIVTGVMQIMAAWRLREEIENEIWLGLAGLLSVIMGVLFIFNPGGGALATVWLIGIYSIAFGIFFIMLAFRVRGMGSDINQRTPTPTPA
jgi:uncharacterized membrane protein HdeD (DUF308 family)